MSGVPVIASYTCHRCGIRDRDFSVRERREDEDALAWMNVVQIALGIDHGNTSPFCTAQKVDLKIPIANRLGEARRQ